MRALHLFSALLLCFSFGVRAEAPLRVGTDENLPPFSFVREGQATGIDVDMLRLAAKRVGIEVDIVALPGKRFIAWIETGQLDMAMPLLRTPEREATMLFSGPVHFGQFGLFVHKDRSFRFESPADLKSKRIGINRGLTALDEYMKKNPLAHPEIEEVGSTEQNIKKLLAGHLDAFVANVTSTRFLIAGTPASALITPLPRLISDKRPSYLVISRASRIGEKEKLAEALRTALERMHEDGTYARIVERHLDTPPR